jgi:hypothetical protein
MKNFNSIYIVKLITVDKDTISSRFVVLLIQNIEFSKKDKKYLNKILQWQKNLYIITIEIN